jgi:hypothetical protein
MIPMNSVNRKLYYIVCLLCFQYCCAETFTKDEIVAKLSKLKSLPKVHYSSPWPRELLDDPNNRLLYECARITNSVSISGRLATMVQVRTAVYTCARINKTNPDIPLTIGVNYSPYHYELDPNVPPTYRGPSYQKELDEFESRLVAIRNWIQNYNIYYKSQVKVGAVLLDMERFRVRPSDEWNEGMREALDTIHLKTSEIYPDAYIEWFGRGMIWRSKDSPWRKTPYFTGKEKLSSLSCSLYFVPEIERTLETYRRTVRLADELKVEDVIPYVSLASGYRRDIEEKFWYDLDWDYDVIYSYLIGRYINHPWFGRPEPERAERFAPFNRAKIVVLYPPPFDPRTPHWGKHFIAYARGARSIKDLSDLGYEGGKQ